MIDETATTLKRTDFPSDFYWGTATASYQIEGAVQEDGRGTTIWDTFSHTPGKVANGDNGDVACDHYHRYKEDIALMKELGLNSYRFSIAWSRLFPEGGGKLNSKGLDFYERLVEELLTNDIQPFATLYHWDLPQALEDKGGWTNRDTAKYFTDYADTVSRRLGDRVRGWITLNEPWVSAVLGHITGEHAPGKTDMMTGLHAAHHLLLAHGMALPVLRRNNTRPDAEFGITLSLTYVEPGNDSQQAAEAAEAVRQFTNDLFLDPLFKGKYPEVIAPFEAMMPRQADDMDIISGANDFLGVNYYFRTSPVAIKNALTMELETRKYADSQYTAMGWEVYPMGLYNLLKQLHSTYAPPKLYITENGSAFEDKLEESKGVAAVHDPDRLNYLKKHFAAANLAMKDGVPLAGYFVWSLLDNFEWAYGYDRRFGITYVDYPTQRRIVKDSGRWYQEFLAQ
jgi:beta-glucosidase